MQPPAAPACDTEGLLKSSVSIEVAEDDKMQPSQSKRENLSCLLFTESPLPLLGPATRKSLPALLAGFDTSHKDCYFIHSVFEMVEINPQQKELTSSRECCFFDFLQFLWTIPSSVVEEG